MWSVVLLVSWAATLTYGQMEDLSSYKQFILSVHNSYRRDEHSADMDQLTWDETAAAAASQWAQRCVFEHQGKEWGENLAFDANPAVPAIKEKMQKSMDAWHAEKGQYRYGQSSCANSAACHYTQMVWHKTHLVGCALKKCASFQIGAQSIPNAYFFVCFYKEKGNMNGEHPFENGVPCTHCPHGYSCINELCHKNGDPLTAGGGPPSGGAGSKPAGGNGGKGKGTPGGATKPSRPTGSGPLQPSEGSVMLSSTNRERKKQGLPDLVWDKLAERNAGHIIHCQVEYPSGAIYYVNFGKVKTGSAKRMVFLWKKDGLKKNLGGRGCRSNNAGGNCNHLTNMLQPSIGRMGCAAKDCGGAGRQFTCLYRP